MTPLLSALLVLPLVLDPTLATPPRALAPRPDGEVPRAGAPAEVAPGTSALLEITKGKREMSYFLRVPAGYDAKRGARLIVFLHGSNMNGLTYLRSFEGAGWAKDAILACPNGEKGDDPYGQNNFTFTSAPLVDEVTRAVTRSFRTTRVYIGGHSQGGFVTYSVIMAFPDLYHGALPMAGDCWAQNEPNLWENRPELLEKQRGIAIAVIHGKKDPVVAFSQGEHAHGVFLAMAYPRLRLFAPKNLGHQFLLSPVPAALEWLDAMSGLQPKHSLDLAERWAKDREWGWAVQAARAVLAQKGSAKSLRGRAKKIVARAEKAAKKKVKGMARALQRLPGKDWVPVWYEFRRLFGATKAAAQLVEHYEHLRKKQRQLGKRLFTEAQGRMQADPGGAHSRLERLLREAPASFHAYYALTWLAARSGK